MKPKHLLIVGATGGTGQEIVRQGLDAGHDVTALVRSPAKLPQRQRLYVVTGSLPNDEAAFADAARGKDAVISALGRGLSFKSDALIQRSVPTMLSAMRSAGVQRLILTSAFGVGDSIHDAPFFGRLFMRTLLKNIYADKAIGEDLVRRSDLAWTIVQPVQMTDGPLTRTYRAGEDLKPGGMPKISRADVAAFILELVDDAKYVRKTVRIAY